MSLLQTLILKPSRLVLKRYAFANLVAQILIVVTGGVVRLTGSGLGCPTWPKCTDASLVTVPEQGLHGIIEFANRSLTGILVIIAALVFWAVLRQPKADRSGLVSPAVLVLAGIFVQAVVGGISVWVKLNPWMVALHFVLSAILISVASLMYWRTLGAEHEAVPQRAYLLSPWLVVIGALTVVIGVLVTGAGPHAGDLGTPRNGLPLELFEHLHSYPGYAFLALALVVLATLRKAKVDSNSHAMKITVWLVVAIAAQATIGIIQARTGVPATLVAIHMFGASVLVSLITFQFLAIRGKR
ncbi:MAG: COX15/CtaA family protein [Micrococcales bacterium]